MQNDTFFFNESTYDVVERSKGRPITKSFCRIEGKEVLLYMQRWSHPYTVPDGEPQIEARFQIKDLMMILGVLIPQDENVMSTKQANDFHDWLMASYAQE